MKCFILLDETMCLACFLLYQVRGFLLFHSDIAFDLNPFAVFGTLLWWKNGSHSLSTLIFSQLIDFIILLWKIYNFICGKSNAISHHH